MLIIYRIFAILALIIGSIYLWPKAMFGRHGVRERFGFIRKGRPKSRLFWFHAASVGELKIISSLLPIISRFDNSIEFAISTTTITGKRRAKELFRENAYVFLLPLELKSSILRTINRLRAEKLIVIETEIWPLLLMTASESGVEIYLANARMSKSSFGKYKLARFLFSRVMKTFTAIYAQTARDAERFGFLGANNVIVTGNIKYDQILTDVPDKNGYLRLQDTDKLIFVAGSVRRGEERILADAISETIQKNLKVGFILVPRHMKEIDHIAEVLKSKGLGIRYRSEFSYSDPISVESVLIVNTMGELRDFYKIADMAFVGGSFVSIGGHDPLEPAALGKPVIFGPRMENAREAADILLKSNGAVEVRNSTDIFEVISRALQNSESLRVRGEQCKAAVFSMTGASEKTVRYLLGELK